MTEKTFDLKMTVTATDVIITIPSGVQFKNSRDCLPSEIYYIARRALSDDAKLSESIAESIKEAPQVAQ